MSVPISKRVAVATAAAAAESEKGDSSKREKRGPRVKALWLGSTETASDVEANDGSLFRVVVVGGSEDSLCPCRDS